jgi:nucleoside-diphosphate-sugar epimerase
MIACKFKNMKPNDFSDARVLVAADAGFIGSALVRTLNRLSYENFRVVEL